MLVLVRMVEEENHMHSESEIDDLVKRYELMVDKGENRYFDVEEFEMLIGHYLSFGEMENAQMVLRYASNLFPESINLQLREAQILAGLGKHIKAIPRLQNLLAFEPQNEEIHLTLASIYSKMEEHIKAIDHFKNAFNNSDTELKSEIRLDIALEYENLGDWKKAIFVLEEALTHDASNEAALFELAFCYDKINDLKSAIKFFNQFLDENPYSTIGWYNLGNAYHRIGSIKKAIDAYDFAIAIDDKYIQAYQQKAEAFGCNDNFSDALETYHEILEMEDATPHTLCSIGECHERLDNYLEAEAYYKKCLDLNEGYPDAYIGLGVLGDIQSDDALAVRCFEQAVLLAPENSDYRLLLATALMKLAKPQEAESQFVEILEKEPKNIEAWEGRVDNLQRLNAHEAALELIEEGLKTVPETTHLRYQEFVSIFSSGEEAKALDLLETLLINHYDSARRIFKSFPDLLNDNRIADRYNRLKP